MPPRARHGQFGKVRRLSSNRKEKRSPASLAPWLRHLLAHGHGALSPVWLTYDLCSHGAITAAGW